MPNVGNTEFAAFLLSDLGRSVMTSNNWGCNKIEKRSKQFLIEKIDHGVKFQNPYNTPV